MDGGGFPSAEDIALCANQLALLSKAAKSTYITAELPTLMLRNCPDVRGPYRERATFLTISGWMAFTSESTESVYIPLRVGISDLP